MLAIDVEADVGTLELRAQLSGYDGTTIIVGRNGAGKSTLLKSILGEIRPSHGTITLGDDTLFCTRSNVNVPTEERRIGYVPQKYALFPHMTVARNVGFGIRRCSKQERKARVMELLEDLGIAHLADRKTPSLSGGESQRVALARALAIRPHALLLDEPMAALDTDARRRVREFLAVRLRAVGIPTVVVSHDVNDVDALGGRVAVLEAGRVVQVGTPDELRQEPATPFVKQFMDTRPAEPLAALGEIKAWS